MIIKLKSIAAEFRKIIQPVIVEFLHVDGFEIQMLTVDLTKILIMPAAGRFY